MAYEQYLEDLDRLRTSFDGFPTRKVYVVARDLYRTQADLDRYSRGPKEQSVDLFDVPAAQGARSILHIELVPSIDLRDHHDHSVATAIGHLGPGRAVAIMWDDLVVYPGGPAAVPMRPRRLRSLRR